MTSTREMAAAHRRRDTTFALARVLRRGRAEIVDRLRGVDRSGALRAAVFGISDGVVSNTALAMGIAGSGAARSTVLLAGVAGLLAGAFSMAAGEYVSMSSQREMFQHEIATEALTLRERPQAEFVELVSVYRRRGLTAEEAEGVARRLLADGRAALETLTREKLGLDPEQLGSPWTAALSSLVSFAVGAFVVVVPYLVAAGTGALLTAVTGSALTMLAVGMGIGRLNGRPALRSGLRQLAVGGLAVAITYLIGQLIGASTA
jgi:VIT1/CCC1 family predicted Fe2+/Mn2+ transporter